jgi:thiosulfate reductase cytochrome b subunit
MSSAVSTSTDQLQHSVWVRFSHWIITISFLFLAFTGFEILMVHPRLYWGEVGNDLTPAWIELPISRNYKHNGYENKSAFFAAENSPVSASRTYDIFNQNGWGRSLHFLSAWFLVVTGLLYVIGGIFSGHFKNYIWPRLKELSARTLLKDIADHIHMRIPPATQGPHYSVLQKLSYAMVIFFFLPLAVMTGFTMSPAISAAYPFLLSWFGGAQSARTIHFFTSIALELFLFVHVLMIFKSGFKQQIRYMTLGKAYEKK